MSPIGQFTVQGLLWEPGQRHTDKVTSPTKLVLDNIGLNTCDICLFQNTTVCSSVLPLDVEDEVNKTLSGHPILESTFCRVGQCMESNALVRSMKAI